MQISPFKATDDTSTDAAKIYQERNHTEFLQALQRFLLLTRSSYLCARLSRNLSDGIERKILDLMVFIRDNNPTGHEIIQKAMELEGKT